ncbi:MAG: RHS repeat domain-containing protein [Pseudomonadota bacterium]
MLTASSARRLRRNATLTQYNPIGHLTQVTEADGYSIGLDRDLLGRDAGATNQQGHRVSLSVPSACPQHLSGLRRTDFSSRCNCPG